MFELGGPDLYTKEGKTIFLLFSQFFIASQKGDPDIRNDFTRENVKISSRGRQHKIEKKWI